MSTTRANFLRALTPLVEERRAFLRHSIQRALEVEEYSAAAALSAKDEELRSLVRKAKLADSFKDEPVLGLFSTCSRCGLTWDPDSTAGGCNACPVCYAANQVQRANTLEAQLGDLGRTVDERLNHLAKVLGCPEWHYPGQIVRDVEAVVEERDRLRDENSELVRQHNESVDYLEGACAELDARDQAVKNLKSKLAGLRDERAELFTSLAFAASIIKCGESWTESCERQIGDLLKRRPLAPDPAPTARCEVREREEAAGRFWPCVLPGGHAGDCQPVTGSEPDQPITVTLPGTGGVPDQAVTLPGIPADNSGRPTLLKTNGKYTRWAKDLTPEQLDGLLWVVGEFSYRSDYSFADAIEEHAGEYGGLGLHPRAMMALRALIDFSRSPITVGEWRKILMKAWRPATQ